MSPHHRQYACQVHPYFLALRWHKKMKSFSWEDKDRLSHKVNIIAADNLAMQAAGATEAKVLIQFAQDIPVSTQVLKNRTRLPTFLSPNAPTSQTRLIIWGVRKKSGCSFICCNGYSAKQLFYHWFWGNFYQVLFCFHMFHYLWHRNILLAICT